MKIQPWSDSETAKLRELYPDTPMPELVRLFGRSERKIYQKVYRMGLKRWRGEEDQQRLVTA